MNKVIELVVKGLQKKIQRASVSSAEYTDEKAETVLFESKAYTDEKTNDALSESKAYTDEKATSGLPEVSVADNGKFMRVSNGTWAAETVPNAEEGSF